MHGPPHCSPRFAILHGARYICRAMGTHCKSCLTIPVNPACGRPVAVKLITHVTAKITAPTGSFDCISGYVVLENPIWYKGYYTSSVICRRR
jgi:hypothetical protein